MNEKIVKAVNDLGKAAYVKLFGFKCVGRKGKNFYFEVNGNDVNEFERLSFEYTNSKYHDFDANIMSLKKMDEYMCQ